MRRGIAAVQPLKCFTAICGAKHTAIIREVDDVRTKRIASHGMMIRVRIMWRTFRAAHRHHAELPRGPIRFFCERHTAVSGFPQINAAGNDEIRIGGMHPDEMRIPALILRNIQRCNPPPTIAAIVAAINADCSKIIRHVGIYDSRIRLMNVNNGFAGIIYRQAIGELLPIQAGIS
ncbi:hypothetical protein DCC62_09465 [candidate division KSB1 bacterium]|nr:MAG: hypothetical protein DCC62_09465 [candidate division KSB1 bacterium]